MNPVYLPSAYMYLSVAIWNKKKYLQFMYELCVYKEIEN